MYCTALTVFGRETSQNSDWFNARFSKMIPVIEAKHTILAEYKCLPSEKSLHALRAARNKVWQTAKCYANRYLPELSEDIQIAAETGNIRGMYDGIIVSW